ncbi:exported hypothetical protein [Planktothrix serta PCC 8927]|uniref:Uncharacterized protein n=1 Tax=Planktothrix serta PCC 8927 TaxID=671068 RepID=A0A7Z9DYF0_9CYAN|nr:exported hypothetical protein [Planktothrix serta PCC 8927]
MQTRNKKILLCLLLLHYQTFGVKSANYLLQVLAFSHLLKS